MSRPVPVKRAAEQGWPEFAAWVAGVGAVIAGIAFLAAPGLTSAVWLLAALGIGAYALGLGVLLESREQLREVRERIAGLERSLDERDPKP